LIDEGVVSDATVFGDGSICGVEAGRFRPSPDARRSTRHAWGISENDFVAGFLGRINRDKGILDLARAFSAATLPERSFLVLAGPDEEGLEGEVRQILGSRSDRCLFTGHVDRPEAILPAFDLFCLPSYREGFGTSVLEASACEISVLASRIYGLTDAVADGKTGWFHEPGDVEQLVAGLEHAVASPNARSALGKAGRVWALERFAPARIVDAQRVFYRHRLGQEGGA
jgi:glycosyltransferase involved in cell wall biosynthesis